MANIVAIGGAITTVGAYTVHTFNSSGTFQVTSGSGSVWYVVVAGGGGGGGRGAAGAGGYLSTGNDTYSYAVTVNSYTVTIGAGGAGATVITSPGSDGNDSVFDTITSTKGGGGAAVNSTTDGRAGGSGGGGSGGGALSSNGGAGTVGQGSAGGAGTTGTGTGGGGGGGASAVGANANSGTGAAGVGGAGTASTISGATVTYAGGGGGGANGATGTAGAGGAGGGGAGSQSDSNATDGTANTGGGGGGAGFLSTQASDGGVGGSGVVIVRYLTAVTPPVADFSGTPTSGTAPLSVTFTDLSTNTPTSWAWTFGDGNTSTAQNPSNNYAAAGTYSVGLTATNAGGSNLKTRTSYITVTSAVVTTEQASNWQATYWKNKSKADRENEEMLERIKLGILPPQERDEADVAVREADEASRLLAAGRMEAPDALLQAMEARARYEAAYRTVFEDAYIAEVVAEHWKEDMKRIARRRKAIALLH